MVILESKKLSFFAHLQPLASSNHQPILCISELLFFNAIKFKFTFIVLIWSEQHSELTILYIVQCLPW